MRCSDTGQRGSAFSAAAPVVERGGAVEVLPPAAYCDLTEFPWRRFWSWTKTTWSGS